MQRIRFALTINQILQVKKKYLHDKQVIKVITESASLSQNFKALNQLYGILSKIVQEYKYKSALNKENPEQNNL